MKSKVQIFSNMLFEALVGCDFLEWLLEDASLLNYTNIFVIEQGSPNILSWVARLPALPF